MLSPKKKIVEILKIHFSSEYNVLLYVQSLKNNNAELKIIHGLCFYLKMLYNIGRGDKATGLMLFLDGAKGFMLYNKEGKIDDSLGVSWTKDEITDKSIISEFYEDSTIRTKIPWGHDQYASKSVLAFLEYLNKSLPEKNRRLLWYSLDALHNHLLDLDAQTLRLPSVDEIVTLPVTAVSYSREHWDEYEEARAAGLEND